MPKLSILMAALASRPWERMHDAVQMQIAAIGADAEFLFELDGGEATSGVKRQRLLERATGDYVAYVDDDDEVSPTYIADLMTGCASGADVVTFNLRFTRPDVERPEIWQFGLYPNRRDAGLMCVNHLCALHRAIATRVAWCPPLGYADDHLWFEPLFFAGLIETQFHIQRVLYEYIYHPEVSANQTRIAVRATKVYVGGGVPVCWYPDGEIWIGVGGDCQRGSKVRVRNRHNHTSMLPLEDLEKFHTVRI